MAETIYHVIDRKEKRVKWDHYGSLDAFVASLSRNPETINEFNQFYIEISGESFYQEGPRTTEDLKDYLIVESNSQEKPEGNLIASLETKDKKLWFIYQRSNKSTSPSMHLTTTEFLRDLYELKDTTEEEVIKRFQMTVNNYGSVEPDDKVREDIPEITPELIDEWKNSSHRREYSTVEEYRRSPKIDGYPVDGIVVADLMTKELRYLTKPDCFDISRERPNEKDKELERKFGHHYAKHEYSLPLEWKLVQE